MKKGQAAMEFLMTYGWAILAAIVVIAVLAAFGVFSPSTYVPSACTIQAPFGCEEFAVSAAGGISMVIRNGGGQILEIHNVGVSEATCADYVGAPDDIADGAITTPAINIVCTPALTEGARFRGDITVTYRTSGGTLDQTATGTLRSSVSA